MKCSDFDWQINKFVVYCKSMPWIPHAGTVPCMLSRIITFRNGSPLFPVIFLFTIALPDDILRLVLRKGCFSCGKPF